MSSVAEALPHLPPLPLGRAAPELPEQADLVHNLQPSEERWSSVAARVPDGGSAHLLWASVAVHAGRTIGAPPIRPRGRCAR